MMRATCTRHRVLRYVHCWCGAQYLHRMQLPPKAGGSFSARVQLAHRFMQRE